MPEQDKLSRTNITLLLQSAWWALQLTWRIHKGLLIALTAITLLHSLAPAGLAFAVRGLVNAAADLVSGKSSDTTASDFLALDQLRHHIAGNPRRFCTSSIFHRRLHDELNLHITSDILAHASILDMAHFRRYALPGHA
jgi:hypothetical protein